MLLRYLAFAIFLSLLSCKEKLDNVNLEKRKNDIVLINTYGERCEMSNLLSLISKKNPKAIGINFIYIEERKGRCDSSLQRALENSKNVVLIESHREGKEAKSHIKFLNIVRQSAQAGYMGDGKEELTAYYRVRVTEKDESWQYSFPFEIASLYDTNKAIYLVSISKPGEQYPIKFRYQKSDFKVLNSLSAIEASGNLLKNKIVLIGLFESGDEDLFLTPDNHYSNKTYGTVILANIVLNILEDLDNTDTSVNPAVNKYFEFIRRQQLNKDRNR